MMLSLFAFHVIDSPALAEELRHVEEVAFPSDFPPRLDDKIVLGIERAVLYAVAYDLPVAMHAVTRDA